MQHIKTAIVHDWLTEMGGAEKVLNEVVHLYPSPIYTLIQGDVAKAGACGAFQNVHTSFLQKLPWASKYFRYLLPLFPLAIEQFDLSRYDLIISSSHAVAKGVLTHSQQLHVCYCHTPMRYAWDFYHKYIAELGGVQKIGARLALQYLRTWDIASLSRVDRFIANSQYIAQRIRKTYGREATVIYPPVAVERFTPHTKKEGFYLTMSRLVPYKHVDLIVATMSRMPDRKLIVVGDGPERKKISLLAGKNVDMVGWLSDVAVVDLMARAKGFIFAAEEDFGIAPVEAQAAGTPVIAYGQGGALETVIDGKTGVFFSEQTSDSLSVAIDRFERLEDQFDAAVVRRAAERFSRERFQQELYTWIESAWSEFNESRHFSRR